MRGKDSEGGKKERDLRMAMIREWIEGGRKREGKEREREGR